MTTIYRTIANESGDILLWDLYNELTGKYYKEPCLEFKKDGKHLELWDNNKYVKEFLKSLKKGDDKNVKIVLKEFCEKYQLDYKTVKKELIEIYVAAKNLKYFKK